MLDPARGPDSIEAWARRYLEAGQVQGLSPYTIHGRYHDLAWFARWCAERDLTTPRDLTKPILERFQRHLFYYRKVNGQPLSATRQMLLTVHMQGFFRWLAKHNHILMNPASDLDIPKVPKQKLREPLSIEEVERVLAIPELDTLVGLRDRAILEVLYSTGIRRLELVNLKLSEVDAARGTVFVREGKGKKDRVVPIGARALAWVQKYLDEVRPELVVDPSDPHLFIGIGGQALTRTLLTQRVRDYFRRASIQKPGACHLFRHTMATLMLDNGADIRFIQELLGHALLDTTQLYTHVSIAKLKAVHAATHPGAKLTRTREAEVDAAEIGPEARAYRRESSR